MLILRANLDDLEVITASSADIEVNISAIIANSSTPPAVDSIMNLGTLASITSNTTTPVVDTSAITDGYNVNVKDMSLFNNHATQSCVTTVQSNDGTRTTVLAKVTLLAGEMLKLTQTGVWLHYDVNGGIYPSVGNAASQAEMEAGTATDRYVTPQGVNWHPGTCKAWGKHANSGTVPQMTATWNTTSVTDNGVNRIAPVIATDFSSANYAISCMAEAATTTYSATTTSLITCIRTATPTVTTFEINVLEIDIGSATDAAAWYWTAHGDQ